MEISVLVPPPVHDLDTLIFRLEKYYEVSAVYSGNRIRLFGPADKLRVAQNYALLFIGPESTQSISVTPDCRSLFDITGVTKSFELVFGIVIALKKSGTILVKGQKRDIDRFGLALAKFDKQCTEGRVSVTPFKLSNLRLLCRKFAVNFDEVPCNAAVQMALLTYLSSLLAPMETSLENILPPTHLEAYRRPPVDLESPNRVGRSLCNGSSILSFSTATNRSVSDDRENIQPTNHPTLVSTRLRSVVIDGSNVAFAHGNQKKFSPQGIRLALEFFFKRGHTNVVAVVPRFRRGVGGGLFDRLERGGYLCYSSSRFMQHERQVADDDRIILQLAVQSNAVVVSNDQFRNYRDENESFRDVIDHRLLQYTIALDTFLIAEDPHGAKGPSLSECLRMPDVSGKCTT
ncbi:unnamed protein product [Dicrocoelium dendriticum]|nr:unnamed protein product [Dicrocoelium dendriticum]